LFRDGLIRVLVETRFRVLSHYRKLSELPPDIAPTGDHCVLLVGIDNDFETVLERLPSIKAQNAQMHVIILGDHFDAEQLLAVVECGADGYLLKRQVDADGLLKSMDLVVRGECVLPHRFIEFIRLRLRSQITAPPETQSRPIAKVMMTPPGWPACKAEPEETDPDPRLSHKERLILGHLTHGASNKHIARELQIAEATVKVHVKGILRKMRVQNRTQAAMWAVHNIADRSAPA
jgi:two-component system nitrate/nitrite response regulator NarL